MQEEARELGVEGKRLTDAAIARLELFDYPGNVRQLENICHWLTVMAPAQQVDAKDLPPELQPRAAQASAGPASFAAARPADEGRGAAVDAPAPIGLSAEAAPMSDAPVAAVGPIRFVIRLWNC